MRVGDHAAFEATIPFVSRLLRDGDSYARLLVMLQCNQVLRIHWPITRPPQRIAMQVTAWLHRSKALTTVYQMQVGWKYFRNLMQEKESLLD